MTELLHSDVVMASLNHLFLNDGLFLSENFVRNYVSVSSSVEYLKAYEVIFTKNIVYKIKNTLLKFGCNISFIRSTTIILFLLSLNHSFIAPG